MNKKNGKNAAIILVLIVFSSCSPLKVTTTSAIPKPNDKIVLVSTFLRMDKPELPLLNAAMMNERMNSISDDINIMFEENINIMRDSLANILHKKLSCEVIYGDKLHEMAGFKVLKNNYNFDNALNTKDAHFPQIIIATDDINPFDFKGQKTEEYFETNYNYSRTIAGIAKALDVNYVAVSSTLLKAYPGGLVTSSAIFLVNHIYVFDKTGNCIAEGENLPPNVRRKGNVPIIKIEPDKVEGYQQVIDTYSETIGPIISKIAEKQGNQ
jgi:hypothetical protein